MNRSTTRRVSLVVIAVTLGVLGACSTKSSPEASDDTGPDTTAVSDTTAVDPGTSVPSSDTSTPDSTDPSSSTPSDDDGGAFGFTAQQLAEFRTVYADAFRAECTRIWGHANADGSLYDPDLAEDLYFVSDCLDSLDADFGEFADSVADAQSLGFDDAQIAASDLADPLCNDAGVCWSYGD
jgi:hypothetical protein